jgi:hypothetical protein
MGSIAKGESANCYPLRGSFVAFAMKGIDYWRIGLCMAEHALLGNNES